VTVLLAVVTSAAVAACTAQAPAPAAEKAGGGGHFGAVGAVVGLDRLGNVAMSFNTTGMGRGYIGQDDRAPLMFTAADSVPLP
jgi:hypothetical protein